jgi:hypothetical protein
LDERCAQIASREVRDRSPESTCRVVGRPRVAGSGRLDQDETSDTLGSGGGKLEGD